ncbi:MAG: hypothetical protein Q9197_002346 [Variospora fuerteventurae]
MPADEYLIASDNGGHAVLDWSEDNNLGGSSSGRFEVSYSVSVNVYRERSWPPVMGNEKAMAVKVPLGEGACMYRHASDPLRRFKAKTPKLPSRNPTEISRLLVVELEVSIASDDGNADAGQSLLQVMLATSLLSPRVCQALSPETGSAVTTIPSWSPSSRGGTDGPSAISVSLRLQLPLDQLCLSLYCLFQLVDSSRPTRCPSSSHFENLEE